MSLLPKKISTGNSLIGILVAIAIFSILSHAIFTLVQSSYQTTSFNRARVTARHLAQEKMELIRNLPYDKVGTVGGIPSGTLEQEESVRKNGLNYTIKTAIIFVDDPFDATSPTDLLATDYKRIRIEVSWGGTAPSRANPIVLVTDVAPKGVESTYGGGTLSIFVFDANAQPVSQADVTIVANGTSPTVNLTLQTADNGRVILPGAPICTACYQITVSKSGYSSERTYASSQVANPTKPHATILEGELTEISFAVDQTSNFTLNSYDGRDGGFEILPGVALHMTGSKTIGTDTNGDPVYKFDQDISTDASGAFNIPDLEWDTYDISLQTGTGLDIAGSSLLVPLSVLPGSTTDLDMTFQTESANNLLTIFTNASGDQIASVSATLSDSGSFEETIFSGEESDPDFGQSFFSDLDAGNYTIEATASGYLDYSNSLEIGGKEQETIILTNE